MFREDFEIGVIALMIMGIPPSVGIAIQLVRRVRQAIWIALGFGALNVQERKQLL